MRVTYAKLEVNRSSGSWDLVRTDRRTDGRTDIPKTIARFFLKLRERAKKSYLLYLFTSIGIEKNFYNTKYLAKY